METFHWVYLIPYGIAFFAGIYLATEVDVRRPENTPTATLRWLMLVFGLAFCYAGFLAWRFDISLSQFGSSNNQIHGIIFALLGVVLILGAAFKSRKALVNDSEYFTENPADIDLSGQADISPSERVNRFHQK